MKRFLPIIVLLASCQGPYVDSGYKTEGIEFSSFEHAWRAIANYRYELSDYPQAPARTFERRTGDCLDCAILLGYYSESMGAEVAIVTLGIGASKHAVVKINGVYFESLVYGMTYPQSHIDKYNPRYFSVDYAIRQSR